MAKTLKFFSGHGHLNSKYSKFNTGGRRQKYLYIAAYTKKEAAELLGEVTGFPSIYTINNYFSSAWGTRMAEIQAKVVGPCVYKADDWSDRGLALIYEKA